MKNIFLTITILIGVLSGANAQNEETRTVSDFSGLKTSGGVKLILLQGESVSVKVKCESSEDLKKITTEVTNGTLVIGGDADDAKVYVTVKTLTDIETMGASSVKSEENFNADVIKILASGASSVKLKITANEITANLSGSSIVSLVGTSKKLTADVSGAASLKALNLITEYTLVSATGASSARVSATNDLIINASGASTVTYRDGAKNVVADKTGASNIKKSEADDVKTESNGDTTKIKFGDRKFVMIKDEDNDKKKKNNDDDDDFVHWAGLDLGVNGFLNANNKLQMPNGYNFLDLNYARSLNFNANFFEHGFKIYRHNIQLVTGLGFEFNHYSFRNPITLFADSNYAGAYWDSSMTYEKNKLNTSFITLPLMLEFNTNNKDADRSFHISGGIILSYNIATKTKQEYSINGYEFDVKKKDDYNINPFRYSATVRAGFGDFNLFASYALNTLFETNKGPKLYPFTVGLTLCNF
jgi:hypothetical protein